MSYVVSEPLKLRELFQFAIIYITFPALTPFRGPPSEKGKTDCEIWRVEKQTKPITEQNVPKFFYDKWISATIFSVEFFTLVITVCGSLTLPGVFRLRLMVFAHRLLSCGDLS